MNIIKKILKKITPEAPKKFFQEIQNIRLPHELQKWIGKYKKIGERQDDFFWKWIYKAVQLTTFPLSFGKSQTSLWTLKTLTIMFVTVIDDIADKTKNKQLLDEILKIPLGVETIEFHKLGQKRREYFEFTIHLWDYIRKTLKKYPRCKEFLEIFEYDIAQVVNEMRYAYLVNKNPYLINEIEYWEYLPYNMQGFVSYTTDLMFTSNTSKLEICDLKTIRKIAWHVQRMARIANWISTWERELKENDFTSGIFAYAINRNIISVDDLKNEKDRDKIVKKLTNYKINNYFLDKWEEDYYQVKNLVEEMKTKVNTKLLFSNLKELLLMHLLTKRHL